MNKQDLIQKLKKLDGLSADEKSALINLVNTKKKYGLVWEDKKENVEEELREKLPVLKEVKEKALIAQNEEAPNHILIEGDNLHALTALTFTHEAKIDVIYIDPPYNTKNKDFKYNDTYVDGDDSFRHSKWLSFMHKRLAIAKILLHESGVIFISIDDNEQAQLKMLCDEIFAENNSVGFFTWVRKKKGSNLSKEFRKITENILCYKRSQNPITLYGVKAYAEKQVPLLNRPNNLTMLSFPADKIFVGKGVKDKLLKGEYGDGELIVTLHQDVLIKDNLIATPFQITGRFRWSQNTVDLELENGSLFYVSNTFRINVNRHNQSEKFKAPSSLISPEDGIGTNEDASEELRGIFPDVQKLPFDYPKPTSLINYIINSATVDRKEAVILDFFAGSGTTLHATMQLNAEDGGSRQCLLVTNNENNICEEVTYERNKRVISGYTNSKGIKVDGLAKNNLRYYKSEYVSRETSLKNKKQLALLATELLSIKEDCYNDITTEFSTAKWLKLFSGTNDKLVCVIHDDVEIEAGIEIIQQVIAKCNPTQKIKVYVFSNGQYPYTEDFEDILDKIELCALPDAIYKAYQNVLPKRKRTEVPEIEDPTAEQVETAVIENDLFNQNSEN